MIVEIQCLPTPAGDGARRYAHVEAAIERIQQAGVRHEVGALGTTLEGSPDTIWPLLRDVHEACLRSGAASVITVIKLAEGAEGAEGDATTMDTLTAPWRTGGT
jgi:uncharacterized protein YqgV (UPF0045/DUF77 family)